MEKKVREAKHYKRKCYTCKKMQWHLGTGLKDEPYICIVCLAGLFKKIDDGINGAMGAARTALYVANQ